MNLLNEIEKNAKFEIKEEPGFVSIVFYRKTDEKMPNSAEKTENLLPQEKIVFDFVLENKKIDVEESQKILSVKERRAREILRNMVKKGILKKIGKTKGSYYIFANRD